MRKAKWIMRSGEVEATSCSVYKKSFSLRGKVERAELTVTATGVYTAELNGTRVSYPLAPFADSYKERLRVQSYDVTERLAEDNELRITVGAGWYRWYLINRPELPDEGRRLIAELTIEYADGKTEIVPTDSTWTTCFSNFVSSELYDGESYDATLSDYGEQEAKETSVATPIVSEDGDVVREVERVKPREYIVTPKGERVIDFGQEITGYVEFSVTAKAGDEVQISHGETLDKDGNFYNENYRAARSLVRYVCRDGEQTFKPQLTFYGFRYIRLDKFPGEVDLDSFSGVVVHSDVKQIGFVRTSSPMINKLFSNIIWGQKGNFLDIPTDCPQRDERLGWTGDAQVFCRAATYNFDCETFFVRWLKNLRVEQETYEHVPYTVPSFWPISWDKNECRAAWADAATIVPWQVYTTYGDKSVLKDAFASMKAHVDYVGKITKREYLWTGCDQFGDWLGLDAPEGSLKGGSDDDFIASAYYAYSTELVVKAGKVLGEDVSDYETLYKNIRAEFLKTYPEPKTQTECALALYFGLTDKREKVAKRLCEKIEACGNHLETGFVGTPYLLHALSDNGYAAKAYELLLREEFPSWLYSVKRGATTIWEHWDGKNERGEFWSATMNSFNHYAYGAVADWLYGVAGGVKPLSAGFEKIKIEPITSDKFDFFEVEMRLRSGLLRSRWEKSDGKIRYEIETPVDSVAVIGGKTYELERGKHVLWG